jgi:VanZ family protein
MFFKWLDVRLARIGLTLTIVAITTLALIPAPEVVVSTGWDKTDHWSAFFTLAFLAHHAFPKKSLWWVAALLVAYGIGIEVAQSFTPTRDASILDVVADSVGIAGYALLVFGWSLWTRRSGSAAYMKND